MKLRRKILRYRPRFFAIVGFGAYRVAFEQLENGLPAIASIEMRVVHLAAGANGGLAFLTVEQRGWSIFVLDRDGVEKQRIRDPARARNGRVG